MPTYGFLCEACGESFDIIMLMKDYSAIQLCPNCNSDQVNRDFSNDQVIDGTPKTIGALADRNAAKIGSSKTNQRRQDYYDTKK